MFEGVLRRIAGRCDVHDRASAAKIARLEEELGIAPGAVARQRASAGSFTEAFADPDLIGCGLRRCHDRPREVL